MKIRNLLILLRNVRIKTIEKGEFLIKKGSTNKDVFFIRKGLIRSYSMDDMEDEITFQLFPENQLVTNIHAVLFDEPSRFYYQALEKSKVYAIDYDAFFDVAAKNPSLIGQNRVNFGQRAMKQAYQRVESFVFLSPEERYIKYLEDYPNVVNRAPDKYIANVLGITPVSLSRIRNRIASKKNK